MTNTPLDLSKRYKTRNGCEVEQLMRETDGTIWGVIVAPHLPKPVIGAGHRRSRNWWNSDGTYGAQHPSPLDLIPCEDE